MISGLAPQHGNYILIHEKGEEKVPGRAKPTGMKQPDQGSMAITKIRISRHLTRRVLPGRALFTALAGVLVILAACGRSQDQIDFEQQAYRTPENYTETTPNGEVIRRDENDWRIGPMFQGFVEVQVPPFPNPTRGEPVQIELLITGVGTVNGLQAVAYYDVFDERSRRILYYHNRSPLEFGLLVFNIYPAEFDPGNNYTNARNRNDGLHRLYIYDNRWNLITYGDIKLK